MHVVIAYSMLKTQSFAHPLSLIVSLRIFITKQKCYPARYSSQRRAHIILTRHSSKEVVCLSWPSTRKRIEWYRRIVNLSLIPLIRSSLAINLMNESKCEQTLLVCCQTWESKLAFKKGLACKHRWGRGRRQGSRFNAVWTLNQDTEAYSALQI